MYVAMRSRRRPGFAMIELAFIVAIAAALISIMVILGHRSRHLAMAGDDLANLRRIGALTGQYAADHNDLFWSFSWKAGQKLSQYPDLNEAGDDLTAAANQAVDIARRRTGNAGLAKLSGWLPHLLYGQFVLEDYAGIKLGDRMFISAGDAYRLLWISDVEGFNAGKFMPNQPPPSGLNWRWPYSTSFNMPPVFYSPDSGALALTNSGQYNFWQVPGQTPLGAKAQSDIALPSQKVLLHDSHSRYFGKRQAYFAVVNGEARVPVLMVDGSADLRATRSANKGWQPQFPSAPSPQQFFYSSVPLWEPVPLSPSDACYGFYRFTRMGTKGRDFDGPEVPSP